ncbi:hypothetical protein ACHJH3_01820 [Campylobacter sp. MOP7]|uniref:hypothetical protein n=1 Tax=Campylobacter canis TaxID=3378588 RepID=UPI00387E735E
MTDKEIALELTKIVIAHTNLKTYTESTYDPETGEANSTPISKTDVAKEAATIYNTIFQEITQNN